MKKFVELEEDKVKNIVISAVAATERFTRNAMNVHLVGISADDMMQYVKCTADRLMLSLGYTSLYKAVNPFDWMAVIGLPNKTNFFESKVSEYARPKNNDTSFDLNADF
jgi:ribonucleoside-diphosphate reductase beta chain